ncbi:MAG: Uma2 family endonuclease [Leptospiraceae bacterium]|nr:Uma2 family endonuclease [Leptospiraceae bacterium]MCP5498028.1 Uma2 family endonuclease [Leptospiraceae bacterium]
MSNLLELEVDYSEEVQEMGSYNHSLVQARTAGLLLQIEKFSVFIELSLDTEQVDLSQFGLKAKDELKPDVCVYSEPKGLKERDMLKMKEMPLLVIEIVSPKQGIDEILGKFEAYFTLGVKSCWLVVPSLRIINVYSRLNQYKTFDMNDSKVADETMGISLPIQTIFAV